MEGEESVHSSYEALPTELLEHILKYSGGRDTIRCRLVCKRWRDIVDSMRDSVWKIYCTKEFHNAQKEFNKADLSWRQLYRSLFLWSRIKDANVTAYKLCRTKYIDQFMISDGKIIVPMFDKSIASDSIYDYIGDANCVVYYDVQTLEEHHRETFEVSFNFYRESDNFKVLGCPIPDSNNDKLTVYIVNGNRKHIPVGVIKESYGRRELSVFNNKICFKNADGHIVVVHVRDGETSTEVSQLPFEKEVITFCYSNERLLMFTDYMELHSLVDGIYEEHCTLTYQACIKNTFETFSHHGINILESLPIMNNLGAEFVPHWKLSESCVSGDMVVIVSSNKTLRFFYKMKDTEKNLNDIIPDRTEHLDGIQVSYDIVWMGAVCVENGQRLFLVSRYYGRATIWVLDLDYNVDDGHSHLLQAPNGVLANELSATALKRSFDKDIPKFRHAHKQIERDVNLPEDSLWKETCEKEFYNSQEDFNKTNITWRQLHKSLKLWSKVKDAIVCVNCLTETTGENFTIRDGLIGVPEQHTKKDLNCDCIVYYNVHTLMESYRRVFDVHFTGYQEAKDFFVLTISKRDGYTLKDGMEVLVVPKINNNSEYLGTVSHGRRGHLTVFDDKVCLKDVFLDLIVVAQVKDGAVDVKETKLKFNIDIVTFSSSNNELHFLTRGGEVYTVSGRKYKKRGTVLHRRDILKTFKGLSKYGFNWRSPTILEWLSTKFAEVEPLQNIRKIGSSSISGSMIVAASKPRSLKFYNDPYSANADGTQIPIFVDDPVHEMTTLGMCNDDGFWIDVVCIENGQRIFMLNNKELHVWDMKYFCVETGLKLLHETPTEQARATKVRASKRKMEET